MIDILKISEKLYHMFTLCNIVNILLMPHIFLLFDSPKGS